MSVDINLHILNSQFSKQINFENLLNQNVYKNQVFYSNRYFRIYYTIINNVLTNIIKSRFTSINDYIIQYFFKKNVTYKFSKRKLL